MKPLPFSYACPRPADETLAQAGDGAKLLAGGQSLVPLLNLCMAEAVIDLGRLTELDFIVQENGTLRVGALTRHRTLEVSDTVRAVQPLMVRAAAEVGHLAIRNRGTIGGSLVHTRPRNGRSLRCPWTARRFCCCCGGLPVNTGRQPDL